MNRSALLRVFSLLAIMLLAQWFAYKEAAAEVAQWSREATMLSYETGARHIEIFAPDRKKKAVIDGIKLNVVTNGKHLLGMEDAGVNTLAELQWSPNSKAFFVTESDGGAVGDWHVTVYLSESRRVRSVDVSKEVVQSFKKYYRCKEPEEPNIGAVKWLNGAHRLLLVAEVPPHSSCLEMGKLRGYIVDIPTGKILQEFSEKKLRADWGVYLGRRLKD